MRFRFCLLVALSLCSCQEVIHIIDNVEPQLVIHAQLLSCDKSHEVELGVSTSRGLVTPDADAVVSCYVNGEYVGKSVNVDCFYEGKTQTHTIEAEFKPGDVVRIEARSGELSAYAENTFPELCEISVDSTSVSTSSDYGYRSYDISLTIHDIPNKTNYYQAVTPIFECIKYNKRDWSVVDSRYLPPKLYKASDAVFQNGSLVVPDDLSAASGLGFSEANGYWVYTDMLFADKSYTFLFNGIDQKKIRSGSGPYTDSRLRLRAATLNEGDYEYYRFLNTYVSSSPLLEPQRTITNVVGGTGFVSTAGITEIVLVLAKTRTSYE